VVEEDTARNVQRIAHVSNLEKCLVFYVGEGDNAFSNEMEEVMY